jgi:hypothetical protein
MSVYATADTHGDMSRFSYSNWAISRDLTKDDTVIVAGDFGLIWSNDPSDAPERYWKNFLIQKPWVTAFVDGNHENHPRLAALPQKEMFGGTVGVVADNIVHLRRGEIYEIDHKKFFIFGGAASTDKCNRKIGVSWWPEELPSSAEIEYALNNLEKHQYAVDYIIAHTCPQDIAERLMQKFGRYSYDLDPTRKFLQHVCSTVTFNEFYCGHWHENCVIDKYHFLYENIMKII